MAAIERIIPLWIIAMPPLEVFVTFLSASVLLALTPGPDNIFVSTQAMVNGRTSAILVTLGLCTGLLVHTSAVAMGVAVIFQRYDLAFNALKVAGGLYLIFLAWQAFRAQPLDLDAGQVTDLPLKRLYLRGIIMNITNPKVSIFFLAFLPQFADINYGPLLPQIFMFGLLFLITAFVIFCGFAFLADTVKRYIVRSRRSQLVLNRVSGLVFCGLAIKLFALER